MPTVLIVNDQKLQRLGYRLLLDSEPDLTPVGEAAGSAEAVRMAAALRPEVLLMQIFKPSTDSIDGSAHSPNVNVRSLPRWPSAGAPPRSPHTPSTPVLVGAAVFPPTVP